MCNTGYPDSAPQDLSLIMDDTWTGKRHNLSRLVMAMREYRVGGQWFPSNSVSKAEVRETLAQLCSVIPMAVLAQLDMDRLAPTG